MQKAYANVHANYDISIFIEFVEGTPTVANFFIMAGRTCKCALINAQLIKF